jgi:osmotically-inducible protein OsmY
MGNREDGVDGRPGEEDAADGERRMTSRSPGAERPGLREHESDRDEAEFIAGNVVGIFDVDDKIELKNPRPDTGDVKESISDAFKHNARLDAEDLSVTTSNGTVTSEGFVGSWAEHDEAVGAAWSAPGVTAVNDDILVAY